MDKHTHTRTNNEKRLWLALGLTSLFLMVELIAAWKTHSLALISDAAHMFTDVVALAISLGAVQLSKRLADRKRTFGYYRFEILAAAFNATLLFIVALYIMYEAYQRFKMPLEVHSTGMLIVASIGLIINLISMRLLADGSQKNINMRAAYLEIWNDMLGSMGVILAAIAIYFTQWNWIDPIVAVGIGLWVIPRTWALLKESIHILLQGVPLGVDIDAIETALLTINPIKAVHDLHIWSLTSGKNVLSVHIVADLSQRSEQAILAEVDCTVRSFGITHTTVQIETEGFHVEIKQE